MSQAYYESLNCDWHRHRAHRVDIRAVLEALAGDKPHKYHSVSRTAPESKVDCSCDRRYLCLLCGRPHRCRLDRDSC